MKLIAGSVDTRLWSSVVMGGSKHGSYAAPEPIAERRSVLAVWCDEVLASGGLSGVAEHRVAVQREK